MKALTIDAKSRESAERLMEVLRPFAPQLAGGEADGFRVVVDVDRDRRIVEVLDALERFVNEHGPDAARVALEGRRYTIHPPARDEHFRHP